jgi:predicted nuclease with TOPRIM domain
MAHRHAPVQHTCPDIDKYIKSIKFALISEREIDRLNEDDLRSLACDMSAELERCIDYLEELRSSNGELRDWGHDLVSDLDDQDKEINRLTNRVDQLEEYIQLHVELD